MQDIRTPPSTITGDATEVAPQETQQVDIEMENPQRSLEEQLATLMSKIEAIDRRLDSVGPKKKKSKKAKASAAVPE
jgi:uncharacterized protein YlxW (UPF0749 family)